MGCVTPVKWARVFGGDGLFRSSRTLRHRKRQACGRPGGGDRRHCQAPACRSSSRRPTRAARRADRSADRDSTPGCALADIKKRIGVPVLDIHEASQARAEKTGRPNPWFRATRWPLIAARRRTAVNAKKGQFLRRRIRHAWRDGGKRSRARATRTSFSCHSLVVDMRVPDASRAQCPSCST